MATLNREQLIKSSQKLKKVELEDGDIYIRLLSAYEVFQLKNKTDEQKPSEETLFALASACICDENGSKLLSAEDVSQLDLETINKIVIEIYEFNNLNPDAVKEAKGKLKNLKAPKDSTKS